MASTADFVVLARRVYEKIQEHDPLPTIALALVTAAGTYQADSHANQSSLNLSPQFVHRLFQKYELKSPRVCAFFLLVLPTVVSGVLVQGVSSFVQLLRTYAIFYATLISSVILYRLSPFHPLAKYPGPVLAKITKLRFVSISGITIMYSMLMFRPSYQAMISWQGKQHVRYRELHKKYGDIVRVGALGFILGCRTCSKLNIKSGPNEIMLNDVSVIAPILGPGGWGKGSCMSSHKRRICNTTDDLYADWEARLLHAPVIAMSAVNDHAEHAHRRRTWTRGFSPAAMKDYEGMVIKRVNQLTEALSARKSVDLARLFGYFS